jgi:hypothetical protein
MQDFQILLLVKVKVKMKWKKALYSKVQLLKFLELINLGKADGKNISLLDY